MNFIRRHETRENRFVLSLADRFRFPLNLWSYGFRERFLYGLVRFTTAFEPISELEVDRPLIRAHGRDERLQQ